MKKKALKGRLKPTVVRVYGGVLQVIESGEEIRFSRFILRESEIAFDFEVTDLDARGRWRFTGTAKLAPSGKYVTEPIEGSCSISSIEIESSIPTRLVFEPSNVSNQRVTVRGTWVAGGERYVFEGELSRLRIIDRPNARQPMRKRRSRRATSAVSRTRNAR